MLNVHEGEGERVRGNTHASGNVARGQQAAGGWDDVWDGSGICTHIFHGVDDGPVSHQRVN